MFPEALSVAAIDMSAAQAEMDQVRTGEAGEPRQIDEGQHAVTAAPISIAGCRINSSGRAAAESGVSASRM